MEKRALTDFSGCQDWTMSVGLDNYNDRIGPFSRGRYRKWTRSIPTADFIPRVHDIVVTNCFTIIFASCNSDSFFRRVPHNLYNKIPEPPCI